jgi:Pyrimidine deaminase
MYTAILEGRKALPDCLPNPPVGCVIVKDGLIVSRGYTGKPGQPHAEAMALEKLDPSIEDFTMFVTLEPCSFQGRTPSCAKAIVKSKVKRVYVGILDPHPKNNGAGIDILKAANIEVNMGPLSAQIEEDLNPYLLKSI